MYKSIQSTYKNDQTYTTTHKNKFFINMQILKRINTIFFCISLFSLMEFSSVMNVYGISATEV